MLRPRRKSEASESEHPTKLLLIKETARHIVDVGVDGVNIDEILKKAGVTAGALYHHFGSVNDLVIAGLIDEFGTRIEESKRWSLSIIEQCTSPIEARERLRWIVATSQVPERNHLRSLRLQALSLVRTQPSLGREITRLQSELTDVMTHVVSEMQRRGWSRKDQDPRAIAVLIQAMNLGRIVDDVLEAPNRVHPDAWAALVTEILDRNFILD